MNISKHASKRMGQRSIFPLTIEWLFDYGSTHHDKRGAEIMYFDKQAKKHLSKRIGKALVKQLSKQLSAYIVVIDDVVITAGYRLKRFKTY